MVGLYSIILGCSHAMKKAGGTNPQRSVLIFATNDCTGIRVMRNTACHSVTCTENIFLLRRNYSAVKIFKQRRNKSQLLPSMKNLFKLLALIIEAGANTHKYRRETGGHDLKINSSNQKKCEPYIAIEPESASHPAFTDNAKPNKAESKNKKISSLIGDKKFDIWVRAFQRDDFKVYLDLDNMKSTVSYSGYEVYQNYETFRTYNKLLVLILDDIMESVFSQNSNEAIDVLCNEAATNSLIKLTISFLIKNKLNTYRSMIFDTRNDDEHIDESFETFKGFVCGQVFVGFVCQFVGSACSELDERKRGYLSLDLIHDIEGYHLDLSLMRTALRCYQLFGVKFELAQKRTIIGDEMGLGKTVQALAAMAHIASDGLRHHFLVICPASVLVNWEREVVKHTKLSVVVLHGYNVKKRKKDFKEWCNYGGICVVTFDGAKSLVLPENLSLDMLVIDEAHYIKNPAAQRSEAVVKIIPRFHRTAFLTGTPLINKLEEFNTLISYINDDVARKINSYCINGPEFRKLVAPVYLRREQSDVLVDLPDRIDSEEWVGFDSASYTAYKNAIIEGNFMAMRQAAYAENSSSKLKRIIEIVHEAADNDIHVVIFSYFLNVLKIIENALNGRSVGIITGGIAPRDRQSMIDRLAESKVPAVLLSQITAGGVGLNIQAASTVILAEPQWSPAIENQAIGRCHRMGQRRTVMVYRILLENSVDQRMLELVRNKQALFDDYARISDLKDATVDAVDPTIASQKSPRISVFQMEKDIIAQERLRLGITQS